MVGMRTGTLVCTAGVAILAGLTACGAVSPAGGTGNGASASASGAVSPPGGTAPPSASPPASGAPPSPAPSPSAAAAACRAGQLKITLVRGGGEGGIASGDIGFANISGTPCRMSGWPALVAITAGGARQAARHVLTTEFGPVISVVPVVTLAPGARAEAVFAASDSSCANGSYQRLSVTAPGTSGSATISAYLPYLGTYLPACGPISVTPVVPASAIAGLRS